MPIRTYLLVGGFNDGNRLPVPDKAETVEVERPGDEKHPPERYVRTIFGAWDHLTVYAREGMDLADVISKLQRGYNPVRPPENPPVPGPTIRSR